MAWRILIVDDEEDVRATLRATLGQEFEVAEAKDGLEALERLGRVQPDLILMDVTMPLMDGYAACEAIRRDSAHAQTPIIFLSGNTENDQVREGYRRGANLYLTKPFESERLLKNLRLSLKPLGEPKAKRLTLPELEQLERSGAEPIAPGSDTFVAPENRYSEIVAKLPSAAANRLVRSWAEPAKPAAARPAPERQVPPRVMIVDDDEDVIAVMSGVLSPKAEVVWATDGLQAIERLVRWQPDILIVDVMMPRMNGIQLCRSIRINSAFRRLPILVCSARCGPKDADAARQAGATDFLAKPFEGSELLKRIEALARTPGFRIAQPKSLSHADIKEALAQSKAKAAESQRQSRSDPYAEMVKKMWEELT